MLPMRSKVTRILHQQQSEDVEPEGRQGTTYQKTRFHSSSLTVGFALYIFLRCMPISCAMRIPRPMIVQLPWGTFVHARYVAMS